MVHVELCGFKLCYGILVTKKDLRKFLKNATPDLMEHFWTRDNDVNNQTKFPKWVNSKLTGDEISDFEANMFYYKNHHITHNGVVFEIVSMPTQFTTGIFEGTPREKFQIRVELEDDFIPFSKLQLSAIAQYTNKKYGKLIQKAISFFETYFPDHVHDIIVHADEA